MAPTHSNTLQKNIPSSLSSLNAHIKKAKELLNQPPPDRTNRTSCEDYVDDLTVIKADLLSSLDRLKDLDRQWQELCDGLEDETEIAEELAVYDEHANNSTRGYFNSIHQAESLISRVEVKKERFRPRDDPLPQPANPAAAAQPQQATPSFAHLPKQTLPEFHGEIISFPTFWGIFSATCYVCWKRVIFGWKFW